MAAIIMVVALHVSAPLAVRFGEVSSAAWWTANVAESLTRPSVPLFIMVSGLLLLAPGPPLSIGRFLRRRLVRVLIPFLIWAVLYLLWRRHYHGESLTLSAGALEILSGPVYGHFWFIYVLLGLYLATPVLQVFTLHASAMQLWWFAALWFAGSSLLPMLEHLTGLQVGIGWSVTLGYVGYFVLGHVLRNRQLEGWQWPAASVATALLVGVTAVGTHQASAAAGSLSETFYANLSPNVVLLSALLFLVLRSLPVPVASPGGAGPAALRWLSRATFGVYLVHPMIQELLHGGLLGFSLSGDSFAPALAIPFTGAVVLGTSLLVVWLIGRLPGGRFMVG